jgi:hypothetical protein
VNPDPPRVGEATEIDFPLANPGPDDIIVEHIEAKVALFGIGLEWEPLSRIGPYCLPADPQYITHATLSWIPTQGGHRCIRATIYVRGTPQPCHVGRNLHVIDAAAEEEFWSVPFRLGNPEAAPAPILLQTGGNNRAALDVAVRIQDHIVPLDRPIWLDAHEEVEAALLLRAWVDHPLAHLRTLEATIHGRFIDGIEVTVRRPARVTPESSIVLARDLAMEGVSLLAR